MLACLIGSVFADEKGKTLEQIIGDRDVSQIWSTENSFLIAVKRVATEQQKAICRTNYILSVYLCGTMEDYRGHGEMFGKNGLWSKFEEVVDEISFCYHVSCDPFQWPLMYAKLERIYKDRGLLRTVEDGKVSYVMGLHRLIKTEISIMKYSKL